MNFSRKQEKWEEHLKQLKEQEKIDEEYIGEYDKVSPEGKAQLELEFPGITSTNLDPYSYVHLPASQGGMPGGNEFKIERPGCYASFLVLSTSVICGLYYIL